MRRALALVLVAVVGTAVLVGAGGRGSDRYRVAAVFDNAAGLIPGQNVEIAGAVVGSVSSIRLTPDHRALVTMDVQSGFVPFRSDAGCEIKPQSLIGEKFVECDPGSPDAKPLPDRDGTPTVPLARTHAPVDIDLVFAALREPYVNRLSLIVNELGTGLAGRPHDLQQAIKRAAPALQQSDRVLQIVNRDRALLGRLIDRTDTVLAQVAPRSGDVTRFVDRAARVSDTVAKRRGALAASLDRLPPLLAELEPSARSLASTVGDARPVVHELRQAAPSLRALFSDLAPLTDAGRPRQALSSASDEGRTTVAAARPIAARLRAAATLIPHVAQVGAAMTNSLRATGAVERINQFVWIGTAAMARFDQTSHIIPSYQLAMGDCNLRDHAGGRLLGALGRVGGREAAAKSKAHRHKKRAHRKRSRSPDQGARPVHPRDTGAGGGSAPGSQLPPLPKLPDLPQVPGVNPPQVPAKPDPDKKLLDFLLGK